MEDLLEVKTITPYEAGKVLHENAETVRAGLRQGIYPFGIAIKGKNGRYIYKIYEAPFYKHIEEIAGKEKRNDRPDI